MTERYEVDPQKMRRIPPWKVSWEQCFITLLILAFLIGVGGIVNCVRTYDPHNDVDCMRACELAGADEKRAEQSCKIAF